MTPKPAPNPTAQPSQQQIRQVLAKLLEAHVDDDANFEKLLQFLRIRKADYYYRGIQYVAPDLSPTGVIDYAPVGAPVAGVNENRGLLDYNIDQIRTYGRKFIATLGQRPFYNMKAVPNDPQSEADRLAAREAEKAYFLLRSQWNVHTKNLEMAYHAWKSGTTFAYTRYVVDPNRYGWSEEPIYETRSVVLEPGGFQCFHCGAKLPELAAVETLDEIGMPASATACASCGQPLDQSSWQQPVESFVPADTGRTQKYPNGAVELHFLNAFFATVPFYAADLESVPFFEFATEEHAGRLVALYPQLRKKMKNGDLQVDNEGGAVNNSGVIARASAASQVGLPRTQSNRALRTLKRTWIRPFFYEMIPDDETGTAVREYLKAQYSNGMKIVRAGQEIVKFDHEKLDDYLAPIYPEVGEFVFRDGIAWGILQHQDAINDVINQLAEIVERCNTANLIWSDVLDVESLNSRPNSPMEFVPVKPQTDLDRCMREMKSPTFPREATQLVSIFTENIQTHTGVLPNVFGAGITGDTTAEANRNQLNQALMQLGTTGEFMIAAWKSTFTNGIWELARHSPRNLPIPGQGGTLDIETLKSGQWHLEGEIGIPRSYAERKDELKALVNQNPDLAKALKVDAPVNSGAVRDYLDLPDLEDPADDERMFVGELIDELLQGEPVQPDPDAPPMPSSTRLLDLVDAGVLDPANTAELIREWVIGPGRKEFGTPGFQNVMAVMRQLKQLMMPPPAVGPDGQPLPPPEQGGPPAGPPEQPDKQQTPTGDVPLPTGAGGPMAQQTI